MRVKGWKNGGGTYGIRVGSPNIRKYFDESWAEIEVEIEGKLHRFALTDGFRRHCPEFRDRGAPVIREWLRRYRTLDWPKGSPPSMLLIPLGGNRFRLDA
jgi:hypothetical protein